jgi:hypothetical protein
MLSKTAADWLTEFLNFSICDDNLFGPDLLPDRLTERNYKALLENNMPHLLVGVPPIIRTELHFMQDGVPAHFSLVARRYLNRKLPDRRIGRGGPIAWSPRSPDLNQLNFYSFFHLESLVCSSAADDVEYLRNRIVAGFQTICNMPRIWDRLRVAMRRRTQVCNQAGGGHIEHLPYGNVKGSVS